MKTLNPAPIEGILNVIQAEIGAAHKLLIGFESAIDYADIGSNDFMSQAQGFDLAMQILADVEHLVKVLGEQFSPESALPHPLPIEGVKLERVRVKLAENPNRLSVLNQPDSDSSVDLF